MKRTAEWGALALTMICTSCNPPPEVDEQLFNRGELRVLEGPDELARFELGLQRSVAGASRRAWLAVEGLASEGLAAALLEALERGVDVQVVADVDGRDSAGLKRLREGLEARDASARLRLTGGSMDYSPEPTRMLVRESAINRMTHNFLLIDSAQLTTWSAPLGAGATDLWVFDTISTDIAKDFEDEAVQLLGGVDATQLSFFDGPLKSNTNSRISYPMPDGVWELYFGPQERLSKRVIDEVYAARASVQIMTPGLENSFLLSALKYKADVSKTVSIMVDARWWSRAQAASRRAGTSEARPRDRALADALTRLEQLPASVELTRAAQVPATVVAVDALPGPDGRAFTTRTLVVSHGLAESIPFDDGDTSLVSDSFMDGHMWALTRRPGDDEPQVERAIQSLSRALRQGERP